MHPIVPFGAQRPGDAAQRPGQQSILCSPRAVEAREGSAEYGLLSREAPSTGTCTGDQTAQKGAGRGGVRGDIQKKKNQPLVPLQISPYLPSYLLGSASVYLLAITSEKPIRRRAQPSVPLTEVIYK